MCMCCVLIKTYTADSAAAQAPGANEISIQANEVLQVQCEPVTRVCLSCCAEQRKCNFLQEGQLNISDGAA